MGCKVSPGCRAGSTETAVMGLGAGDDVLDIRSLDGLELPTPVEPETGQFLDQALGN